ncbi:MAG: ABC transporter ATP-binding protein [Desulfobacca sp.]|uniref:ABC transporter ATP-binding protein n=1 Tax=Desulfobacca sp. TaxID=2067990 RepID=UPI0040490E49
MIVTSTSAARTDRQPAPASPLVVLQGVTKTYRQGSDLVQALQNVYLDILDGEFVAVTGKSGCGKSTLLHVIGGLESVSAGRILFQGRDLSRFSEEQLTRYRRDQVGIVFQSFNLMPLLTIVENVALPQILRGTPSQEALRLAEAWLDRVNLQHRRDYKLHQVSGGEMQRAAVARALINQPALLLADEPTGNLDSTHASQVLQLFAELQRQEHLTVIMVTHAREAAQYADRVISMQDGRLLP